ncbi:hypothetical protein [Calorimonas adulescens]|uniref:hypothetical protein n=1 Tax=Calorimonas adulescens TaxID=2606906 RepID=UPI001396B36A|nr:hypothetical protein [Calorimonas adulescens]
MEAAVRYEHVKVAEASIRVFKESYIYFIDDFFVTLKKYRDSLFGRRFGYLYKDF